MLRQLEISAIAINGDECWFFLTDFNRLLYKNLKTEEIKDCGFVPWESKISSSLFRGMEYVNEKIYLIPYAARCIVEYDIKKAQFSKIEIDENIIQGKKFLFRASFTYENKVFLFGVHVHKILVLDSADNNIRYIDNWTTDVEKMLYKPHGILSRKQLAFYNNKAILPLFYGDGLLIIDYIEEKAQLIKCNFNKSGYIGICVSGDDIWLTAKDGTVFCTDINFKDNKLIFKHIKEKEILDEYIIKTEEGIRVYTSDSQKVSSENEIAGIVKGKYDCIASNLAYNAFWTYDKCRAVVIVGDKIENIDLPVDMTNSILGQIYSNGIVLDEKRGFGLSEYLSDISRWDNE